MHYSLALGLSFAALCDLPKKPMTVEGTTETLTDQAQRPPAGGLSLHGAVWTHLLLFCLRILPAWLCEWLAHPVVWVVYVLAGDARRGLCANLEALFPDDGPLLVWLRGWRVFLNFGLTYLDRLLHLHLNRKVQWEAVGENCVEELREEPGGALIFTIHSGNYDIGATLFAEHLDRELHIVRVEEQQESLQELRSAELRRIHPKLHIHYNKPDAHLGLLLCNLIRDGQVVAVQADRVLLEVSPVTHCHEGVSFKMPRGPLMLAEMTRVPCYPIFLRRLSRLRYGVEIHPALTRRGEKLEPGTLSTRWLEVFHPFLKQHWDQWFVFEALLSRAP